MFSVFSALARPRVLRPSDPQPAPRGNVPSQSSAQVSAWDSHWTFVMNFCKSWKHYVHFQLQIAENWSNCTLGSCPMPALKGSLWLQSWNVCDFLSIRTVTSVAYSMLWQIWALWRSIAWYCWQHVQDFHRHFLSVCSILWMWEVKTNWLAAACFPPISLAEYANEWTTSSMNVWFFCFCPFYRVGWQLSKQRYSSKQQSGKVFPASQKNKR